MVVNADLIRTIEDGPETHLTLTSGEKLAVREPVDEVVRRVIQYQQTLRSPP